MRVAVISDIHGNTVALDAVLADAAAQGVEEHWFLGDYSAIGPEPVAVLERITALPRTRLVRGNTDRYLVTGEGPPPLPATVRERPELVETFGAIVASFAWTRGYVTASGWLDWFAQLPPDLAFTGPGGLRVHAVHAAPGTDDGEGIHPGRSTGEIRSLVAGVDADLVFVGHTHEAMMRRVDRCVVVNVGSVSNPRAPDLRASWLLLEAVSSGTQLTLRRVEYDHAAFAETVARSRHPAADYIMSFQRGAQHGRAPHPDHTGFAAGETVQVALSAC